MLFMELKPTANYKDICDIKFLLQYKIKLEQPHVTFVQNVKWRNALNINDMTIQKIVVSIKRDVSCALEITLLSKEISKENKIWRY